MDIGRPTTKTEVNELIYMIQYNMDFWIIRSHVLDSLTDLIKESRDIKIICDNAIEVNLKDIY